MLYAYQCGTCDHAFDAWSPMEHRNDPRLCSQCNSLSERVLVPTPARLPFNDDGFPSAYERWANDRDKRLARAEAREE
ncbi:MAG: FmdB family zinc ribbon protein [Nitrososphaera sp.]